MATGPAEQAEEVRTHVLSAHEQLRQRSAELAREALRVARGANGRDLRVRALVYQLWSVVQETDQLECRELIPLLANADAWGAARVDKLHECHARHEREICALADELGAIETARAALERIDCVLTSLLHDLDDEEATSLETDLLRQDGPVIVTEQTSG
jgi:hypothetical protein